MSWTVLERIDLAVSGGAELEQLLLLLGDAADHIRDQQAVIDDLNSGPDEGNEAELAFADLARDIRDVLNSHGI